MWGRLGNQFSRKQGLNPRWVVLFCRVTAKTQLAENFAAKSAENIKKIGNKVFAKIKLKPYHAMTVTGKSDIPRRNVSHS